MPMPLPRRSFLASSAGVLCGLNAPGLLGRAAFAAPPSDAHGGDQTVLVVVQLSGGNDGLNAVVPLRDPAYCRARPKLGIPRADCLRVDAETGFAPSLRGFADLLESGRLAVVRGVGYPNPDRSHFESMDVWHRGVAPSPGGQDGDADSRVRASVGWLGRALPALGGPGLGLHVGGGEPPLALRGTAGPAPSLRSADAYRLKGAAAPATAAAGGLLGLVQSANAEAAASSERVWKAVEAGGDGDSYPDTGLAGRLKLVARLIDAGLPERVYYTDLPGFDTHAVQPATHPGLLEELGGAVAAFFKDLSSRGQADRVVLLAFSEFGRRVAENGSGGTDHGVAGPLFLAGPRVKPGLLGPAPSLTDLDAGDLRWHTDFRTVYAALLENWLGVDAAEILGGDFKPADVLA